MNSNIFWRLRWNIHKIEYVASYIFNINWTIACTFVIKKKIGQLYNFLMNYFWKFKSNVLTFFFILSTKSYNIWKIILSNHLILNQTPQLFKSHNRLNLPKNQRKYAKNPNQTIQKRNTAKKRPSLSADQYIFLMKIYHHIRFQRTEPLFDRHYTHKCIHINTTRSQLPKIIIQTKLDLFAFAESGRSAAAFPDAHAFSDDGSFPRGIRHQSPF